VRIIFISKEAMKKLFLVILTFLLATPAYAWVSDYTYRKQASISSSASLTDYQVLATNPIYDETGLLRSWHFNEGSGASTADSSGNGNTGTITGATWSTSGKFGNGLSFDGNDNVNFGTNVKFTSGDFSISFWFNVASLTGTPFSRGRAYGDQKGDIRAAIENSQMKVAIRDSGSWIFGWLGNFQTSTTLTTNTWYYLTITRSGSTFKMYLNGNLENTQTSSADISDSSNSNTFYMGYFDNDGGSYYNGKLDEFRIYNRALSASEITALYNAKARLDYADIRFTDSDGDTQLNYWMEKDGNFWVKVPSIPSGSKTIYGYYGNASASSGSNGDNTFNFFDDFADGSINTGKWTTTGAGVSESAGTLQIVGNNSWNANGITSITTFDRTSQEYMMLWKAKFSSTGIDTFIGYSAQPLAYTDGILHYASTATQWGRYRDGTWLYLTEYAANTWYDVKIRLKQSQGYTLYRDSTSLEDDATFADNSHRMSMQQYDAGVTSYFDYVYVRKYASPEPTLGSWSEESVITVPTVTTSACTSITSSSATGNGNITATGGASATTRGFCYMTGTSGDPTTANSTAYDTGSFGTGAYTKFVTNLSAGTNYRVRAYAINSAGTGYGTTVQLLTTPAAPTNVSATDGTYTDKVTITWTKSTGATGYRVYRDSVDVSGLLGDVATYDDAGAAAPTITPGTTVATDGTSTSSVNLSLSGASVDNGTSHTYKVVAVNSSGNSADSTTNTGYRGVGSLTYQWQRSAGDSDATYSDISGATTDPYSDTVAPAYTVNAPTSVSASAINSTTIRITYSGASVTAGAGRYYKCVLNATGAAQQTATADRGYRNDTLAASDGYEIFSDTAAGGSYATSEGVDTASPFDDIGLDTGTTKFYKVKAESTAGTWSSLSTAYGSATSLLGEDVDFFLFF